MKKLTCMILVGVLFFMLGVGVFKNVERSGERCCFASGKENAELELYSGEICHLFTHCLIVHPEVAFCKDNEMAVHYDADCMVYSEFKKLLYQLYQNNYMLCDVENTYEIQNGKAKRKSFLFPKGKKPLVLSFDDVVYDPKKSGKGMADKLEVENGKIVARTNGGGTCEREFVSVLDNFVKAHPDFSYQGAKGIICLTGYCGVLGYRTMAGSENKENEIEKAKVVVDFLKNDGWKFASHSYAHAHMKKISPEKMREDAEKWNSEVASIVGKTPLYVYPYGEWEIQDENGYISKKHKALCDAGFSVFFGVGSNPFYSYLPYNNSDKSLFMDRCSVDGVTLRGERVEQYFNPKEVILEDVRKIK